jgi:hypothetical protein
VSIEDSNAGKVEGSVLVTTMTVSAGLDATELVIAVAPGREIVALVGVVDVRIGLVVLLWLMIVADSVCVCDRESSVTVGDGVEWSELTTAVDATERADGVEASADVEVLGTTELSESILVVILDGILERRLVVALTDRRGYELADAFRDKPAEPVAEDRNVEFADNVEDVDEDGGLYAGRLSALMISAAFGIVLV